MAKRAEGRLECRTRPRIRVGVVSDDRLLCAGLLRILSKEGGLAFVGQVDRPAFVRSLRAARPQVLLVDSRMEGALDLCATLRREHGPAAVFFMAERDDDDFAVRALEAGARGILAKSAPAEHLVKAVCVVHEGEIWARRQVLAARLEQLASLSASRSGAAVLEAPLSLREREVFRHAAMGLRNRELADRLGIGEATVKAHLTRIFEKLGLRGRSQLAAAYHGMIASDRAPAPRDGEITEPMFVPPSPPRTEWAQEDTGGRPTLKVPHK